MPWEIKPVEGGYAVFRADTGERKNRRPVSKKRAAAYMRALYAHAGSEAKRKEILNLSLPEAVRLEFKGDLLNVFKAAKPKPKGKGGGRGYMPGLAKHLMHQLHGDPHFFTKCMAFPELQGYDTDARAGICARAHKMDIGIWPGEHGGANPTGPEPKKKKEILSSLVIFKEASGKYRWVTLSSNAFRDLDGEIISRKSLEADCERADRDGDYGPLRWWHLDRLDIGDCDFNAVIGRTLVESGTFRDNRVAERIKEYGADRLQVSLGFKHPVDEPDSEGVFHTIRRFERSLLPLGRASNQLTRFFLEE